MDIRFFRIDALCTAAQVSDTTGPGKDPDAHTPKHLNKNLYLIINPNGR